MKIQISLFLSLLLLSQLAFSQDEEGGGQSRESMAVDATASQWSFQFAFEGFLDYKSDSLSDGTVRPEGRQSFVQFRLVAPIQKSDKMPITLLPRLTLRYQQNAEGNWGFGASDLFVLGIAQQWATGRWGIGPQINFPAQKGFGSTNFGLGFAAAVTQRALNDKLFFAFLLQQVWAHNDVADKTQASPIGLNPIVVYQLGKGWYIGNGDFVINYNWQTKGWLVPFGVRIGKAIIGDKNTWNAYIEYQTPLAYKSWTGPVPSHAIRVNLQFQIPVGGKK